MTEKHFSEILSALAETLDRKNTDIFVLKYELEEAKKALKTAEDELARMKGVEV